MTKRELLEACAKATGIPLQPDFAERFDYYMENPLMWNPIDNSGDCADMEAKLKINVEWRFTNVACGSKENKWHSPFANHTSPQAARRWASCRAVAAMEKL